MEVIVAKVISVVTVLILALVFGTLPYCLVLSNRVGFVSSRKDKIIKILNCFSGGVFLGALFMDLMIEGGEEFENYKKAVGIDSEYPFFNGLIILGFFLTSTVEHFAHAFLERGERAHTKERSHPHHKEESQRIRDDKTKSYGTVAETSIMPEPESSDGLNHTGNGYSTCCVDSDGHSHSLAGLVSVKSGSGKGTAYVSSILLLLALCFHSVFDGLALGLQDSTFQVWQILLAVGLHKSVVAFCLGLDIFKNFPDTRLATMMIVVFALIAPIGASVGISLTASNIDQTAKLLVSGILQGLSCGAFLYVTFLEILNKFWRDGHFRRSFLDIAYAFVGFAIMAGVKVLDQ